MDPVIGHTIAGRFRIEELLGTGGFGAVYRGVQLPIDRSVAVKLLHEHHASEDVPVRRFLLEAQSTSKLRNQHTMHLYDFGREADGRLYMVMEYVPGPTLAQLADGPMDVARGAAIGVQICESLHEAHDQGIVHRDLKPENIKVEARPFGDFVKVLDFGLAKLRDGGDDPAITAAGQVSCTPSYASPEQVSGQPVDGRSDLYSLGIVLYRLWTGHLPFPQETAMATMVAQVTQPPPDPHGYKPDLPEPLRVLLLQLLAKTPDERPASAEEVRQRLRPWCRTSYDKAPAVAPTAAPAAPAPADSLDVEAPTVLAATPLATVGSSPPVASRRHARLAGGVAAAILVAGLVWTNTRVDESVADAPAAEEAARTSAGVSVVSDSRPPAAADTPSVALPRVSRSAALGSGQTRRASESDFDPAGWTVALRVVTTPPGARLALAGVELGRSPFEGSVDYSDEPRTLLVRRAGYQTVRRTIRVAADTMLEVRLRKSRRQPQWLDPEGGR